MFLVFAGDQYYPLGGARDFIGKAGKLEEALEMAANSSGSWWHVTDDELNIQEQGER